jgi:dUTP pyrophosphatase
MERAVVDTGVYLKDVMPVPMAIAITKYRAHAQFSDVPFAMVCSRSGLAVRDGVIVLNAPGIVDADYEDTIKVILLNTGDSPVRLTAGTRIAQLVFAFAYRRAELVKEEDRQGGLGSTGTGEPLSGSTDRENRSPGSTGE